MSWLFTSVGQSIGDSASILPVNIQGWFPLRMTGLISLLSKGLSRVFANTTVLMHRSIKSSVLRFLYGPTLTSMHDYWKKNHSFDCMNLVSKVVSLPFNMLGRFVIAFLPRSKRLLISAATVHSDFGTQENKVCHCFHCFHIYFT